MRISRKCQYALRAVFELSVRNAGRPVKIHDIADAQNIPPRFLEVIMNQLRHAGLVESRRGNEGGYMLAGKPQNLTVGQVVACVDGPISITDENTKNNDAATFFGDYAFEQFWQKVNDAVSTICDNTTFAELVEKEKKRKTSHVTNYTI